MLNCAKPLRVVKKEPRGGETLSACVTLGVGHWLLLPHHYYTRYSLIRVPEKSIQ